MARKKTKKRKENDDEDYSSAGYLLSEEVRANIYAIISLSLSFILILAYFNLAGSIGRYTLQAGNYFLGWGYFILPLILLLLSFSYFRSPKLKIHFNYLNIVGATLVLLSSLTLLELFLPTKGGLIGKLGNSIFRYFGFWGNLIMNLTIFFLGVILTLNSPIHLSWLWSKLKRRSDTSLSDEEIVSSDEPITNLSSEPEEVAEPEKKESLPETQDQPVTSADHIPKFKIKGPYKLPSLSLLDQGNTHPRGGDIRANANIIKRTLESFGIEVEMGEVNVGPTVTQYTLRPVEGVKLSSITALQNDLSLALAAHPLRIEAPIPGKSLVGIEVPNKSVSLVKLGNIFKELKLKNYLSSLTFPLGRDVKGKIVLANLAQMPHLLIAGATGTGKSVSIHSLLMSLLMENSPQTLRLILVDPKRVELSHYNGIDHLVTPVITDNKKVLPVLRWVIHEMEHRYDLLSEEGVRDIKGFNKKAIQNKKMILPYLVVVIDELADLMMAYGRDLEGLIIRIAQMSRATGIHLVISTQRPSVEVITGLIKANITARVALQVASQVDSRTILDMGGAEKLLGHGDMLYLSPTSSKPLRIQGAFISEEEVDRLIDFIIKESNTEPDELNIDLDNFIAKYTHINIQGEEGEEWQEDELYPQALELVTKTGKASASFLQRKLRIGYARAARLLDMLEEEGVIGPGEGAKPRQVYIRPKNENGSKE